MNDDVAAYVGVDWASATHYAYALDAQGAKLGHRSFVHSGDGWLNWQTGFSARQVRSQAGSRLASRSRTGPSSRA